MNSASPTLSLPFEATHEDIRWFCAGGSVTQYQGRSEVHVGGLLIGQWSTGDHGIRNILLAQLAAGGQIRRGNLSQAFGVSRETTRLIRRQAENDGLPAVAGRVRGGSRSKVTPALRRKLERWFKQGVPAYEAHKRLPKSHKLGRTTVWRVHKDWKAKQVVTREPVAPAQASKSATNKPKQRSLAIMSVGDAESVAAAVGAETGKAAVVSKPTGGRGDAMQAVAEPAAVQAMTAMSEKKVRTDESEPLIKGPIVNVCSKLADNADTANIADSEVKSGRSIQHLGTWLMLALVMRLGLHSIAAQLWGKQQGQARLRIALDAVIMALALSQQCVEGVRRLGTVTAPVLLRAAHAPSANWVRRTLHSLVEVAGSTRLHVALAFSLLDMVANEERRPVVFYIDNHLRPYTGKHTIRRGWRMQDKRVLPGTTDYYVHDEDGRPVLRVDVPSHDSLTKWLTPIARLLRERIGTDERVLLAFDRAGAFPKQMAALREDNFEFVTYERKPFARLPESKFDREVAVNDKSVGLCEAPQKNLGKKRGRVRRIAVRTEDGNQVNLVAISKEPAEFLISVMMADGGRWRQENAFKHGVQRWGFNQLDGRKVVPYPPEAVIPNPARRRLDRALRIARASEGSARRGLARYPAGGKRREKAERDLSRAMALQAELEAQRPHLPTHAPLQETELAGKLVQHDSHYKTVVDTIRIACANAESELACALVPHLKRPAEAKKLLANLFAAPGNVTVGERTIGVTLQPAGTASELAAYSELFSRLDGWDLVLPGDPLHRKLRFRCQI